MTEWAEFGGVIGRYRNESTPWWPDPVRAPAGAPNVLVILLDDVGFAQLGCFGSDIATPTFDRLAANGLRYSNFHTTALCSPTRACVLTGRNHHKVGMGRITDLATGFPGYHARIGKEHGFLSEVLGPLGYGAYAVGKWHLTPDDERHLGASRARWPLQRGFDRFYGFFGGETHQFAPSLVHDSHRVAPPRSWEDGYHLSEDIAEIGRLDDTLVFALSDNGASSEGGKHGSINDARPWNLAGRPVDEAVARIDEIGGPRAHNNYPWGWTVAGNTPFRRWKREVHEGGVADPLIVSWPARIGARGEMRRQYVHAVDLAPTVLDVLGVEAPDEIDGDAQTPIDGVPITSTFDDPDAPSARDTQYYEMFGCRALYHDGWKAVVYHPLFDQSAPYADDDAWELYHVAEDASECHDVAAEHPDKLRELVARWWSEAESNLVLPLDNSPFDRIFGDDRPGIDGRRRYVYYPFAGPVTEEAAVNVRNRSHRITAEVEVPQGGAEGILLAQGTVLGVYVLFVLGGQLS